MGMFSNFNRPMPPGVGRRSIYEGPSRPWVDPPAPQDVPNVPDAGQRYAELMGQGGLETPMVLNVKPSGYTKGFDQPSKAPYHTPPMRPEEPAEVDTPSVYDAYSRGDNPWRGDLAGMGGRTTDGGPGRPGDGLKAFFGSGAPQQFQQPVQGNGSAMENFLKLIGLGGF